MNVSWSVVAWNALDRDSLYAVVSLRERVFVVEQACAYLDADGLDPLAMHLLGHGGDRLVAYARFFPPGERHRDAVIGRVVVEPDVRGRGLGQRLVNEAVARTRAAFGPCAIHIHAQHRLETFYRELGFVTNGEPFDEDGIPHVPMRLAAFR